MRPWRIQADNFGRKKWVSIETITKDCESFYGVPAYQSSDASHNVENFQPEEHSRDKVLSIVPVARNEPGSFW